jgi:hypothetical protein
MYIAAETPPIPLENGTAASGTETASISSGEIAWRHALFAAVVLAIPSAVLTISLPPVGLLWTVVAAGWAVATYARRARTGHLSTGIGARIGLLTGLFVSWLTAAFFGVGLWISRFVFHEGGQWDSLWQAQVEKSFANNLAVAQVGTANLQAIQLNQALRAFALSADGRAGVALSGIVVIGGFLILLAAIGGAVGARFVAQARRPSV